MEAVSPSNCTESAPERLVPLIVTVVPPPVGPEAGLRPLKVAGAM